MCATRLAKVEKREETKMFQCFEMALYETHESREAKIN